MLHTAPFYNFIYLLWFCKKHIHLSNAYYLGLLLPGKRKPQENELTIQMPCPKEDFLMLISKVLYHTSPEPWLRSNNVSPSILILLFSRPNSLPNCSRIQCISKTLCHSVLSQLSKVQTVASIIEKSCLAVAQAVCILLMNEITLEL